MWMGFKFKNIAPKVTMEYLQKEKLPQKTEANGFLPDFLNLGLHNLYKAVKQCTIFPPSFTPGEKQAFNYLV